MKVAVAILTTIFISMALVGDLITDNLLAWLSKRTEQIIMHLDKKAPAASHDDSSLWDN